ncbi:Bacterial protein of uncharacterised function (Gcw_chp) [Legionella beliardensis]|uniref:Bacterial protein of uncharacterized function (Gcw_chp) n=1 Tax=Legionella beliardensis TaxID=91822 RepID=A0A378HZ85_9GAMM|nr:TorF family putative porin [Legionella beliardensis]STX27685.1 Bacterial protein of uncharacterised function (Gcw_chp) [Legionella beliardensis]
MIWKLVGFCWITFVLCSGSSLCLGASNDDAEKMVHPSTKAPIVNPKNDKKEEQGPVEFIVSKASGSAALLSNYVFRGITQTESLPAIQVEFTYTFPIGLYLTVWGSNAKFAETDINMEIDPFIGFYQEVNDDFNYDISYYKSFYPSASEFNYTEWIAVINYKFLQTNLGFSNNVYNVHKIGYYYNGGINYTIPSRFLFDFEGITLLALIGHYHLPKIADLSYNDYTLGLSKNFKNYNISFQWTTTNHTEYYGHYGGSHFAASLIGTF